MFKTHYLIIIFFLLSGCKTTPKQNINLNFSIPTVEYVEK